MDGGGEEEEDFSRGSRVRRTVKLNGHVLSSGDCKHFLLLSSIRFILRAGAQPLPYRASMALGCVEVLCSALLRGGVIEPVAVEGGALDAEVEPDFAADEFGEIAFRLPGGRAAVGIAVEINL
jgi:hypothetical protein